jgi:GNAT superfamily N-acetyltransferase
MNDTSTLRLNARDRRAVAAHFLALGAEDRRLRFGGATADESIEGYVDAIDFARDCVFGVHDERLRLVAVVHVALAGATAELGLSVLPGWRGKGNGDVLLKRAVVWLRNRGTLSVYVHCITENAAMMRLARRNGMGIAYSGAESDGRLELDSPTPNSYLSEWIENGRGQAMHAMRQNVRFMEALFALQR